VPISQRCVLILPYEQRGVHDIEKEIKFAGNSKMVAHDSEGFEAGTSKEVDIVKKFIERRSMMENVNDRLHLIWFVTMASPFDMSVSSFSIHFRYCMEMNSRPLQRAENEFFSTSLQGNKPLIMFASEVTIFPVPVVAIVTKFDSFAQDVQQEIEEAAEEEQREVDEEEVEKQAFVEAMTRFEQHYKQRLERLPFPPKAIVTLSNGKLSLS
jgi:hypothetical protein